MKNLRDQLSLVLGFLMLIGSDCTRHRCPPVDNRFDSNCETHFSKSHLICTGGFHGEWRNGSDSVRSLTLCNFSKRSFDPVQILEKFPYLKNLSVFFCNFTHFTEPFPSSAKHLQYIRFNGTRLRTIREDAFSSLPSLRILDLRHNDLSSINSTAIDGPVLESVYLSGNPWKCSLEMSWILNLNNDSVASRVVDRDKMLCAVKYFHRPVVPVVEILQQVDIHCPKNICSCKLTYVGRQFTGEGLRATISQLTVFVTVNCSSRNLTEIPLFLPKNTTTVYLSNNKISDLTPLKENPVYKDVKDVYLDNNIVDSILILEGSAWLDQFRVLSLRGNLLAHIPPYAIENALQINRNPARIYLGKNPWQCDCHFTPGFQHLLIKYKDMFKDVYEITCAKVENDENSDKMIIDLSRAAICTPPDDSWIQPLDLLNAVLTSLILFVYGKLLYDYWNYRRTGQLPWIVTKIP